MRNLKLFLACGVLAASMVVAAPAEDPPVFVLKWGSGGTGAGQFRWPYGLATDPSGNVYVVDTGNSRVQKFTGTGTFLVQWGGPGPGPGLFNIPRGIAVSPNHHVYVTHSDNVEVFTQDGVYLESWNGSGTAEGSFRDPRGVAIDTDGNVYVTDAGNSRVQKFTGMGDFITAWGSDGKAPGQFVDPTGIAIDHFANVYVADRREGQGRIQKFTSTGTLLAEWITPLVNPFYVAIDGADNLYAVDNEQHKVFKFTPAGTISTQWGSFGTANGQFRYPTGIAIDQDGAIFVADPSENIPLADATQRIQKFSQLPVAVTPGTWGTTKRRYR